MAETVHVLIMPALSLDVLTVVDLALVEQIDDVAECERLQADPHRAEFVAVCRKGCGTTILICGRHLARLRRKIIDLSAEGNRFGCATCRTAADELDGSFRVERL